MMIAEIENYFFHKEGDIYAPQATAGSPWSETMQHGGPVNAIITMSIEAAAQQVDMQVARLTMDILKPVPMQPMMLKTHFVRKGGKMAVVDTFMTVAGSDEPVASGRAVLLKATQGKNILADTSGPQPEPRDSFPVEPWIPVEIAAQLPPGLHHLIQFHPSDNSERPVCWINGPAAMLQDRAMTPLEQCATTADMTTVLATRMSATQAGALSFDVMDIMNTNTSIHFARPPVGEWFAYTDHYMQVSAGYGLAGCVIYDEQGCVGQVTQNLIVNS